MKWIIVQFVLLFLANSLVQSQNYHPWQKQNRYKPLTNEDVFPFKIPLGSLKKDDNVLSKMGFEDNNLIVSEYELSFFADRLQKSTEKVEIPAGWGNLYPLSKWIKSNKEIKLSIVNSNGLFFCKISNFEVEGPLDFESYSICSNMQEICPLKINVSIKDDEQVEMFIFSKYEQRDVTLIKKDSTIYQAGSVMKYEFWQVDLNNDNYIDAFKYKRSLLDTETMEGNLSNNELSIIIGTYRNGKWLQTGMYTSNDEYSIGY